MARGKKKETLTPEERLQAALVPESEQPYKVPGNWCWTYLKSMSKIQTGKKDANYGSVDGEYPFFTCAAEPIRCHGYSFDCNAILLAGNGDINNISCYNGKFEAYQRTYVVEIIEPINTDYVFYWFKYKWFDFNKDKMFGTAIPYIRLGNLQDFPVPVPPIKQQQRIVDRIENLFAKLDEAKQKAQDTLDSFETRKAAILHKAFTGELTAQWRKEHGVRMESWDNTTLSKIVIGFKYGTSEKSDYSYKGMPVFRIPNITDDGLSFEDLKFLSHKDISDENQIHENDILIVRSNGSRELVGKSVLVPQLDREYAYASFLIRIQPLESVVPNYLVMYLNSTDARMQMFKKAKSSAGINNINSKELGAILINLPSFPEQTEIVRILDDLLAKEQQAKEAAEGVLEQIDLIKKSILARAFRGELGTNDPNEESAQELLKKSFIL
ncbi:restriction endonuclease subunit S [Ruthenibacterium sp. CLA-JM-H11]|uniref:Restriction endonuclease subunit S n=1 Tax=Ruthenibacterium intestinale TaxID=3133163 RepID=A0ABV1GIH5_9FIRM